MDPNPRSTFGGMRLLATLAIAICSAASVVEAWWDGGHMLIGEVARLTMNSEDVKKLEDVLALWQEPYEGLSMLSTASCWADHIKCQREEPYCSGLPFHDNLIIFNDWHFIKMISNPQNVTISGVDQYQPLPREGAIFQLKIMFDSMKMDKWLSGEPGQTSTTAEQKPTGSVLAWNLQLRLLIHIFGDIHQPLHCSEMYSKLFPKGDKGGNLVYLDVSDFPQLHKECCSNLHQLWDSAGGKYGDSWPKMDDATLKLQAAELIHKYPQSYFGDRFKNGLRGLNFDQVALDTHNVATTFTYSEFPWNDPNAKTPFLPYKPSEEYMSKIQDICSEQIALGGYRLANVLTEILGESFPHAKDLQELSMKFSASFASVEISEGTAPPPSIIWMYALSLALAIFVVLYLRLRRKVASNEKGVEKGLREMLNTPTPQIVS